MDFYLKINGVRIEWASRNKIRLDRFNPMFDYETVQGSRVADFTIPYSPEADKLFNWYYLPQSKYKPVMYYTEKYAYGELIERGFVYLVDVNEEGYVVAFTQDLGEFFGDYQTILLNKLPLGSEVIPAILEPNPDIATAKYAFPTIINPLFYGTEAAPWYNGKMNEFLAGDYVAGGTKVPMLFGRFLFDQMASLCNFKYEGEFFESNVFKRMLLFNTFSLDELTSIDYANHLSTDLTFPGLLIELRKLFNVAFFFDVQRRIITGTFVKTLMNQATKLNYTHKIAPTKKRTPVLNNRFSFDWELESNDELMKITPADYLRYDVPGEGQLFEIKTKLSTLDVDAVTGLAMASQIGISKRLAQGAKEFRTRILFWNGLVDGVPMATNQVDDVRLAWHGSDNIVERFWAETVAWRKNTSFKPVLANLTATDLAIIDFHSRKGETVCLHSYGKDYYIANVKAQLPLTEAVELELWER